VRNSAHDRATHAGALAVAIVARLGLLNIVWLFGLVAAWEVVRLINPIPRVARAST
jgi:hypothetical protein